MQCGGRLYELVRPRSPFRTKLRPKSFSWSESHGEYKASNVLVNRVQVNMLEMEACIKRISKGI